MRKPMRFLLCASTAALLLGAAPIGAVIIPAHAQVAVAISAGIAPPLLPVYAQPPIPGPGYLWIPGYWAWDGQEYYWVPGYWALPPAANLLWTPPYWAWNDGVYDFYPGYWAPTVGFYGGIDYGFGYTGVGYQGGYWQNNQFFYNTAVNNLAGAQVANTYARAVPAAASHVSFNGGSGGITARPTGAQIAERTHATPPTAEQTQHQQMASRDPALRFNANHGRPPTMAMQRANEFHGASATIAAHPGPTRAQTRLHAPVATPGVAERGPTETERRPEMTGAETAGEAAVADSRPRSSAL
jgi:WXXGXW repeat (2 copies)